MPAKVTKQICIPAGCDYAIKVQLMLSHSYGMQNINISIAGISKRFHFASLHYIFSAYLPTHIKFLTEFHRIFFGTTCISILKIITGLRRSGKSFLLNNHFSLSMLSVSALRDNATTSKSENFGMGPRREKLPDSLTRFSENCLRISSILTSFV